METRCPFCKQVYDVEDEALGQVVECPECNNSFSVESLSSPSVEKKSVFIKAKNIIRSIRFSKRTIIYVVSAIMLFLIVGIVFGIYNMQPNESRAIQNRARISYLIVESEFQINNRKAIKTLCEERAKLEFKEAKKQEIEDEFILFWCDKDVVSILKDVLNIRDKIENEEELKKTQKRFQEVLDIKYPQNEKILGLTGVVEKEYSPINQIILKHGYARSLLLKKLDEKFSGVDPRKTIKDAETLLAKSLYNLYSKDEEIKYPAKLKELCNAEAKKLFSYFQDNDLAVDWAKLILSEEFKKALDQGMASSGTTHQAFLWLQIYGESQINQVPYGCSMKNFLKIDDYSFWGKYYSVSHYGVEKK